MLDSGTIRVLCVSDLAQLSALLESNGNWIHSMEVFEQKGETAPLRVDLSLLGLNGEDEIGPDDKPAFMRDLLRHKIQLMRASGCAFKMEVWLGE